VLPAGDATYREVSDVLWDLSLGNVSVLTKMVATAEEELKAASVSDYATSTDKAAALYSIFSQSDNLETFCRTRAFKPATAAMAGTSADEKAMQASVIRCLRTRDEEGRVPRSTLIDSDPIAELLVRNGILGRDPTPKEKPRSEFAFSSGLMIKALLNRAFKRADHPPTDLDTLINDSVRSLSRFALASPLDGKDATKWKEAAFTALLHTYRTHVSRSDGAFWCS